jgi:hypothetical protein
LRVALPTPIASSAGNFGFCLTSVGNALRSSSLDQSRPAAPER